MKLETVLQQYDEKSLRLYAKDMHVDNYNKLSIAQLSKQLSQKLLQDAHINQRLSILDDQIYRVLLQILDDKELDQQDNTYIEKLIALDLVYLQDDEVYIVDEIKDIVTALRNDTTWSLHRSKMVWLLKCQQVIAHYWGTCSIEQLQQLLLLNPVYTSEDSIEELLVQIPIGERQVTLHNHCIQWNSYAAYQRLIEYQPIDSDHYVPSVEEINDLYQYDFDIQQESIQQLRDIILQKTKLTPEETETCMHDIWNSLSYGLSDDIVQEIVNLTQLSPTDISDNLRGQLEINTRKFIYKGHTYKELYD